MNFRTIFSDPLHFGTTQGEGIFGSETESTLKDAVL